MKAALRELPPVFSMDRVVQEYARRFYVPALEHAKSLAQDKYAQGRSFADWLLTTEQNWTKLKVGEIEPAFNPNAEVHVGETLRFKAQVYLDSVSPDNVSVQLYEGPLNTDGEIERGFSHDMECVGSAGREGWYEYSVEFVSETTGQHGYTVRLIPRHADLHLPLRLGLVTWAAPSP
jgi:starch phosphorylase